LSLCDQELTIRLIAFCFRKFTRSATSANHCSTLPTQALFPPALYSVEKVLRIQFAKLDGLALGKVTFFLPLLQTTPVLKTNFHSVRIVASSIPLLNFVIAMCPGFLAYLV
jgi:hypothetical protein